MSDYWDANPIHEAEREERRDAVRYAEYTSCYRHDYRNDRRGGGVCVDCGDYISPGEL